MSADDEGRSKPSIDVVRIESASDPLLPLWRQLARDFFTELGEDLEYQEVELELAARQRNTTQRRHSAGRSALLLMPTLLVLHVQCPASTTARSGAACTSLSTARRCPLSLQPLPAASVSATSKAT